MIELYDFDAGLAQMERLEVLIESPLLRLLAPALPPIGMSTKPSAAEPAVLMVVGAASLIHGSDRRGSGTAGALAQVP